MNLCHGCFLETRAESRCPRCGWEGKDGTPMRLPLGETLERGRYRLGRLLGQPGSFGMVYLGWDLRLRRRVAIKEFLPDYMVRMSADQAPAPRRAADREDFERDRAAFLGEAQLLAELTHSQIVEAMDHFEERGTAYLVMKYYEGQTLAQNLTDYGGRMTVSRALGICYSLLDPLAYLHRRGYLHGDLKPANIYLARREEGGERPTLLDFGASRRLKGERSATLESVITQGYAAPEQIREKEQRGARSDIYGLGAVLYRLLTGKMPPPSLERELQDRLIAPQRILPELSSGLEALILQMLELDPKRRPADCEALKQAMEPFLWGGEAPASQEPKTERTQASAAARREGAAADAGRAPRSGGEQAPSLAGRILDFFGRRINAEPVSRPGPKPARGLQPGARTPKSVVDPEPGARMATVVEGVEFAFRWCPAGSFTMGSPKSEEDRSNNETPHEVRLTCGFWLQETVVTQRQWEALMGAGSNPSQFKGADRPVEMVSWKDALGYCGKLKTRTGIDYRLPTEAEWEYACRAGTRTPFHYGERLDATMANFNGNYPYGGAPKGEYRKQTTAVRSFAPNAWGLYDMHGNVWEWCADWYGGYPEKSIENPIGPAKGADRVLRGGSWYDDGWYCRSANRIRGAPGYRGGYFGFRLATSSSGK